MKIKITSKFTPNDYFPATNKEALHENIELLLRCIITNSITRKCEVFLSDRIDEKIKELYKKEHDCCQQVTEEIINNLKVKICKK